MTNRKVHRSNLRFQFIAIAPGAVLHDLLTESLKALFQPLQMFSYGYVHRKVTTCQSRLQVTA